MRRACLRGPWLYAEMFSRARIANTPGICRCAQPAVTKAEEAVFGAGAVYLKTLVAPSLPSSKKPRRESADFLRSKGVDGVIEFPEVLSAVIDGVEKKRNYQRSDVLQLIRVLKTQGMLREPQLELFRAPKPRRTARKP